MRAASTAFGVAAAALIGAIGCSPGALDPKGDPMTGGTTGGASGGTAGTGQGGAPADDLAAQLKLLAVPGRQVITATNGGAVMDDSFYALFEGRDPEALMEAAASAGLPVCSIEPQALTFMSATSDGTGLSLADAKAFCSMDDLATMTQWLGSLKTPQLVVVVAANAGITFHSTNNGINFVYGDDIPKLVRTARRMYVPVCDVRPDVLSLPTPPSGESPGLSVDQALARCGRS